MNSGGLEVRWFHKDALVEQIVSPELDKELNVKAEVGFWRCFRSYVSHCSHAQRTPVEGAEQVDGNWNPTHSQLFAEAIHSLLLFLLP